MYSFPCLYRVSTTLLLLRTSSPFDIDFGGSDPGLGVLQEVKAQPDLDALTCTVTLVGHQWNPDVELEPDDRVLVHQSAPRRDCWLREERGDG